MSIFSIFSGKREAVSLPFATDMHCHVLPGVDDGSPDLDHSVELIKRMQAWGISRIVATPHVTETSFENTPDVLDPALHELRDALDNAGINVALTRASENRIDDYFRALLEHGQITPMPGNYLLVECSFIQEPWQLDQFLFDLTIKGYRPILAHPERYYYFHGRNKGRYAQLHDAGTLFQINVLSLAEGYGKTEKKVAEDLIASGYVDFLGTDLHNRRHADVIDHYLTTGDARKHFRALEGHLLNDSLTF